MVFLYLQSAPSFVQALTDASFDAVVMNPESDVLVEFYAPVRLGVHRHTLSRNLPLQLTPLLPTVVRSLQAIGPCLRGPWQGLRS